MRSNVATVTRSAGVPDATLEPSPELTIVVPTFNERSNVRRIVERLRHVLTGLNWEVIFVDDNSPDGTAEAARAIGREDRRVRCIRRIDRRGLAGACIEGILASQARYVAVIDGDLQHDEGLLVTMLDHLRTGNVDLVVASRYLNDDATHGLSARRARISSWSTLIVQRLLGVNLSDPMSGFFMIRRAAFEDLAPRLSSQGFKLLLDIATTAHGNLRVAELPYTFRGRQHGESKLDTRVAFDFIALVIAKLTRDAISYRFILFCLVGLTGIAVHMSVLNLLVQFSAMNFVAEQAIATGCAITWNFCLNNAITYRDRRLKGWRFLFGLVGFYFICGAGAISNIGIASVIYSTDPDWWLAGLIGALIGVVWNYVVSLAFIWRL
jgi:dolichol-phosphate mannosyltransferase